MTGGYDSGVHVRNGQGRKVCGVKQLRHLSAPQAEPEQCMGSQVGLLGHSGKVRAKNSHATQGDDHKDLSERDSCTGERITILTYG